MRYLCLLVLLLPLAACDTMDPEPPALYDPPTPVSEASLVTESTEAALAERRAQWEAQGIDDYRFEFVRLCGCLENRVRYVVTVRAGAAREATRTTAFDSLTTVITPDAVPYPTISTVFDAIQDGFDIMPDDIEARYRASDGLPGYVFIDPIAGRTEDELVLFVAGFDRL